MAIGADEAGAPLAAPVGAVEDGVVLGVQVRGTLDWLLQGQSVMVATNKLFMLIGGLFIVAAVVIWLAPRPTRQVDPGAAH